jgi:hypothetical protein
VLGTSAGGGGDAAVGEVTVGEFVPRVLVGCSTSPLLLPARAPIVTAADPPICRPTGADDQKEPVGVGESAVRGDVGGDVSERRDGERNGSSR